ncbi:hypothetical protein C0J52_27965 [Blattella germanica]|nr:hypothetical protein C0J52_27965 [Blattella germanica]
MPLAGFQMPGAAATTALSAAGIRLAGTMGSTGCVLLVSNLNEESGLPNIKVIFMKLRLGKITKFENTLVSNIEILLKMILMSSWLLEGVCFCYLVAAALRVTLMKGEEKFRHSKTISAQSFAVSLLMFVFFKKEEVFSKGSQIDVNPLILIICLIRIMFLLLPSTFFA